jgi:hypothetical protein
MKIIKIAESTTLNELNAYADDEIISELVTYKDLNVELPVYPITPEEMKRLTMWNSNSYVIDAFEQNANSENKMYVSGYMNDPLLADSTVVVYGNNLIDGHHRVIAAIKKNINLKKVDLYDLPD